LEKKKEILLPSKKKERQKKTRDLCTKKKAGGKRCRTENVPSRNEAPQKKNEKGKWQKESQRGTPRTGAHQPKVGPRGEKKSRVLPSCNQKEGRGIEGLHLTKNQSLMWG